MCFSRPTWEGGQYNGDEKSRWDALQLAMELGADYIDVELQVLLLYEIKNFEVILMLAYLCCRNFDTFS